MRAAASQRQRVREQYVDWLNDRLSSRDRAILTTLAKIRVATGEQLERLHFAELAGRSRTVVRWRVLKRLVDWRVLVPLQRRIGGSLHGSAKLVFALDTAGQRLTAHEASQRRPRLPGERFLAHTLDVSELYVQLREAAHSDGFEVSAFQTEPGCWVADGLGSWLKPDAYAVLSTETHDDDWWLEIDRATEHLPTLRRKLAAYVDFARRGQLAPSGVMPRVLVTVPDKERREAVASLIDGFSDLFGLVHVQCFNTAANFLSKTTKL
ncbi:replication-relaxation family protein [Fodinicola acaciae]|uniref:replication-relaxation family protein n=1 Tax=Fodinicola acaciae TaxID=2681555 RepID=UPI0013D86058|nr:replication-relaxation family protein [Fodinicola acaciae]